jgi:hypothetical protein
MKPSVQSVTSIRETLLDALENVIPNIRLVEQSSKWDKILTSGTLAVLATSIESHYAFTFDHLFPDFDNWDAMMKGRPNQSLDFFLQHVAETIDAKINSIFSKKADVENFRQDGLNVDSEHSKVYAVVQQRERERERILDRAHARTKLV